MMYIQYQLYPNQMAMDVGDASQFAVALSLAYTLFVQEIHVVAEAYNKASFLK